MSKVIINGTAYELFPVSFEGFTGEAFLTRGTYIFGRSLCIRAWGVDRERKQVEFMDEITVNGLYAKGTLKEGEAMIRNYGGNETWSPRLAEAAGARDTGRRIPVGEDKVPVYDFSGVHLNRQPQMLGIKDAIIEFQ